MTCIACDTPLTLTGSGREFGKWEMIRASVFWGFILLVIVSPGVLGTVILMRG